MPHIHYSNREILFKIVYYGPGMSGKTTNLQFVYRMLARNAGSEIVTLDTGGERTLFFDFLPLEFGTVHGYDLRFHMYTVPGQMRFQGTRHLILEGADGVVFVADSLPDRYQENVDTFQGMLEDLASQKIDPRRFPLVMQYNKRDCRDPLPLGFLEKEFDLKGIPVFEAVAVTGQQVMETMRGICRRVIENFQPV
jgi:mutual gliding-motility protein MglA